ncbi:acyl carrier protein [Bdellovibrio sp. HCB209]|uniref:acyl carrier protein n=1 Tax=Bdellovibrio sp. HCB209 TaxID=3394354 RepID=UPI0039B3F276
MRDKITKCLSTALEVKLDNVKFEDITAENFSEWDSLKQIEIVVLLEEEFDVRFSEEDVPKIKSATAIESILSSHGS